MLRPFFTTLQTLPTPTTDAQLEEASAHAFELICTFLRSPESFSHQPIHRLVAFCWSLIRTHEIALRLEPGSGKLPSLHFLCLLMRPPQKSIIAYLMPRHYLELVRTDPVMQCCALVNMASQGCDYATQRLDPQRTPERAKAYEAEFLLALRPLLLAENLPWTLNAYLREVLKTYPQGLASFPQEQRFEPPSPR